MQTKPIFRPSRILHFAAVLLINVMTPHLAVAEPGPASNASPPLRVGAVLSLTGIAASHGNAIRDGVDFAKAELARQGRAVEIVYEDDGSAAKQTVSAVERLAAAGIHFIIGPTWGILAEPAGPAFRRHNILSFQPANSSDFVAGGNPQFFFVLSPPSSAKSTLHDFLKRYAGANAAIINVESQWGTLWQRLFREAAAANGVNIVLDELPQFTEMETALKTLTTKLRQKNVSILLSTTWSQGTALTVAELERQQLPMTVLSPDLNEAVCEGLVQPKSRFVDGFTIIPQEDASFRADFERAYSRAPRKYTDTGYDALMVIAAATAAAGTETDAVKKHLLESFEQKGRSGMLKFGPSHDVQGSGYVVKNVLLRQLPSTDTSGK